MGVHEQVLAEPAVHDMVEETAERKEPVVQGHRLRIQCSIPVEHFVQQASWNPETVGEPAVLDGIPGALDEVDERLAFVAPNVTYASVHGAEQYREGRYIKDELASALRYCTKSQEGCLVRFDVLENVEAVYKVEGFGGARVGGLDTVEPFVCEE